MLAPSTCLTDNAYMPDVLIFLKGSEDQRRKIRFSRNRLVIGRANDCDLTLGHGTLSRHHCAIIEDDGQWYLEDVGSSNGTRCNGKRVTERTPLQDGDRIAAGRVRMVVSGLGGRRTSIYSKADSDRPLSFSDDSALCQLGDLGYQDKGWVSVVQLMALADDDDFDRESLDLDDDGDDAEIQINTMIRSVMGDHPVAPADADPAKLKAWDDIFGDVDRES